MLLFLWLFVITIITEQLLSRAENAFPHWEGVFTVPAAAALAFPIVLAAVPDAGSTVATSAVGAAAAAGAVYSIVADANNNDYCNDNDVTFQLMMMVLLLLVVLLAPASPGISIAAGDARSNKSKQHHHHHHLHHQLESGIVIIGDATNSATGTVCDGHLTKSSRWTSHSPGFV